MGYPIARRYVFAGLGALLASPLLAALPTPAFGITYDKYIKGVEDTKKSNGITFIQRYYYRVGSSILSGRGRQVYIYKEFYQSRGTMDFTTRDEVYCNGKKVCTIPRKKGSWRGPKTVRKNEPGSVGFIAYGGGVKKITTKEVEEVGGTAITSGLSFSFTIPWYIEATCTSGGSISSKGTVSVDPGSSKTYTATPSEGHHIVRVEVDGVGKGAISKYTFSNVSADHNINAVFAINTYRVRFFPNYDNEPAMKTQTVNWGADATAPADPVRSGYRFLGWDRGFKDVKSDIDVYARWDPAGKIRYHSDGEHRHTQNKLTPGTTITVPQEALDACRRPDCTPGWTGWFTDPECTKRWSGGKVPAGTLDLYSYNDLTLSFATTSDSAGTSGDFRTSPDDAAAGAILVPDHRVVRYGKSLGLTLPAPCYRNDGDGHWRTYRPSGYFGTTRGDTPPQTQVTPSRDTVLYVRWSQATADGVQSSRGA